MVSWKFSKKNSAGSIKLRTTSSPDTSVAAVATAVSDTPGPAVASASRDKSSSQEDVYHASKPFSKTKSKSKSSDSVLVSKDGKNNDDDDNDNEPLSAQELSTLEVTTASLLYGSNGNNVNSYYKFMGVNPLQNSALFDESARANTAGESISTKSGKKGSQTTSKDSLETQKLDPKNKGTSSSLLRQPTVSKSSSSKSLGKKSDFQAPETAEAPKKPSLVKSGSRRKSLFGLFHKGQKHQPLPSSEQKVTTQDIVSNDNKQVSDNVENQADSADEQRSSTAGTNKAASHTDKQNKEVEKEEFKQNKDEIQGKAPVQNIKSNSTKNDHENPPQALSKEATSTDETAKNAGAHQNMSPIAAESIPVTSAMSNNENDHTFGSLNSQDGGVSSTNANHFFAKHLAKKSNNESANTAAQQNHGLKINRASSPALSDSCSLNYQSIPVTPNQDSAFEFLNIDTNVIRNGNTLSREISPSNTTSDFVFVSSPQSALTNSSINGYPRNTSMIFERNVQEPPTFSRRNSYLQQLQQQPQLSSRKSNGSLQSFSPQPKLARASTFNPSSPTSGNCDLFHNKPLMSRSSRKSSFSNFNLPPGLKAIPNHYRLDDYISPALDSAVSLAANISGNTNNENQQFFSEGTTNQSQNQEEGQNLLDSATLSNNSSDVNLFSKRSRKPSVIETSLNDYLDKTLSNRNYSSTSLLLKQSNNTGAVATATSNTSANGSFSQYNNASGNTSPNLTRRSSNLGSATCAFDLSDAPPLPHRNRSMTSASFQSPSPRKASLYIGLSPYARKKSISAVSPTSSKLGPAGNTANNNNDGLLAHMNKSLTELTGADETKSTTTTTTANGRSSTVKSITHDASVISDADAAAASSDRQERSVDFTSYADLINSEHSYYPGSASYSNLESSNYTTGDYTSTNATNETNETNEGTLENAKDAQMQEENEQFFDALNGSDGNVDAREESGKDVVEGTGIHSLDFNKVKV